MAFSRLTTGGVQLPGSDHSTMPKPSGPTPAGKVHGDNAKDRDAVLRRTFQSARKTIAARPAHIRLTMTIIAIDLTTFRRAIACA